MHRQSRTFELVGAALCAGALAGCAQDLPDVRMIEGTRILALRVEVIDPLFPDEPDAATRCQALPFETVRLDPWIVDPKGPIDLDELDPVWIACQMQPGQGLFGCISAEFPTELDDIEECTLPDLMDLESGELPDAQSPCLIGRDPQPEFTVPLNSSILIGGQIEVTMISGPPGGTSTEACARALLSGDHEVPDDCIMALQRLEIGPLEQLLIFADQFGIDLGFPPPDPEDVPDFDRNPRVSRFEVAILDEDGEPGELVAVERGGTIEAAIGDTLRIETSVPEEDLQTFPQQINDNESEDDQETLDGDYYRTFGSFLNGSVDDPDSYDEWTLEREAADEPERPEDDRATLFLTMRDSRTGVDWWWFHVDIVDED